MRTANRVAFNSVALYANMGITMAATLLGTRYVLQALGREDFGLYTLIASMVALLSFLNVAMAAASQRFLSYAMGEGDERKISEVFYTSSVIHWLIASMLSIGLLAVGEYMIHQVLDIAPHQVRVAEQVLWCMVGGVVLTICAVPYEAAMNAHEDIAQIAGINIVEALCKLGAAVAILFLSHDQLLTYALLVLGSQLLAFAGKRAFSRRKYAETHFRLHRLQDPALLKGMLGYAGWNLIGAGCSIARYQGAAILLNTFFGLLVNAAYGVAQQVNGFILFFANSIVRPLRPLIVKAEGQGDRARMHQLAFLSSRVTFLMVSLAIVPLYLNMPFVLALWLKEVPAGALEFCRTFLLLALINQLTIGSAMAVESVGNIRRLQLIVGSLHVVSLPMGYAAFSMGYGPVSIMYCMIAEEGVSMLLRIWIARKDAGVPSGPYLKQVLLPCILVFALSYGLGWTTTLLWHEGWGMLMVSTLLSTLALCISGYHLCLSAWEKDRIREMAGAVVKRKK